MVPVKEKMQQPPKKVDFRYRSIVPKRDNFGSHPIDKKIMIQENLTPGLVVSAVGGNIEASREEYQ